MFALCCSWLGAGTATAEDSLSYKTPLYIDMGVRLSRAPDGTIMSEPAFELSRPVSSYLALGIGLTGGSAPLVTGQRHAFTVAPSLDVYRDAGPLRGYARFGMATQYRDGGRLPDGKSLALFAGLGARAHLGLCIIRRPGQHGRGCMTAATEVRVHRALSGGWLMNPAVLPRGSSIVSTGITFGWEV